MQNNGTEPLNIWEKLGFINLKHQIQLEIRSLSEITPALRMSEDGDFRTERASAMISRIDPVF